MIGLGVFTTARRPDHEVASWSKGGPRSARTQPDTSDDKALSAALFSGHYFPCGSEPAISSLSISCLPSFRPEALPPHMNHIIDETQALRMSSSLSCGA